MRYFILGVGCLVVLGLTTNVETAVENNQACRSCEPKYLDNGQYAGYKVCAYVPWNASCGCTFKNGPCQNEQSWCDYYV